MSSATDGKPDGDSVQESAGSFYLFSASTGEPNLETRYHHDELANDVSPMMVIV